MSTELRAKREALESLWRQGLSGSTLLKKQTALVDDFIRNRFSNGRGGHKDIALLALGGYGRGELFPFSDIDLMLLYAPAAEKNLTQVTESVFYPLWDAGLEVGHGVRTVKQCLQDAKEDAFFQIALLDARYLSGSVGLFENLQKKFREKFIDGQRRQFLTNMGRLRVERLERFGMHSYLLEPNIKEGRGGLRDCQSMLWSAKVLFGMNTLVDLEQAGLVSKDEAEKFENAWDNLIRIRNRLHYVSARKNDQLYFENQEDMAEAFGYKECNGLLGVERFMREVYSNMHAIALTADMFFEHAHETIGHPPIPSDDRELRPGISVRRGRIHLSNKELLAQQPKMIMKLFSLSAKTGNPLHYWSRRLVTSHLHRIDDTFRTSATMAKAFMEILLEAVEPHSVLSEMLDTGFLAAYIPEFNDIASLAQHDVYHVYTVDRHLLQTVAELRRLQDTEPLFKEIKSPHILFLAALLHDIGKGKKADHSKYGADLAGALANRLGFNEKETELLAFLVQHHLFLMGTAMRRDLEDESLIVSCAQSAGDADRLAMLYLLTIADARATGPTVWSEWKAALVLELYLRIANLLENPEMEEVDAAQGAEWMRTKVAALLHGNSEIIVNDLPEDYLLSYPPETVSQHVSLRKELVEKLAVVHPGTTENFWSLTIISRDRTGLLAKICGILALYNLEVIGAHISTWPDGTVVDVFDVVPMVEIDYDAVDWRSLEKDLNHALDSQISLSHRLGRKFSRRMATKHIGLQPKPQVVMDNTISHSFTVIELYASNHPKLLYDVTRTLADFGINIFRAKIGTKADQVVDVFYTLDKKDQKISNEEFQEEIRQALIYAAGNTQGCNYD